MWLEYLLSRDEKSKKDFELKSFVPLSHQIPSDRVVRREIFFYSPKRRKTRTGVRDSTLKPSIGAENIDILDKRDI